MWRDGNPPAVAIAETEPLIDVALARVGTSQPAAEKVPSTVYFLVALDSSGTLPSPMQLFRMMATRGAASAEVRLLGQDALKACNAVGDWLTGRIAYKHAMLLHDELYAEGNELLLRKFYSTTYRGPDSFTAQADSHATRAVT